MLAAGPRQRGIMSTPPAVSWFQLTLTHGEVFYMHLLLDQFLDPSSAKKELHPQFWILSLSSPLPFSFFSFFFSTLISLFRSLAPVPTLLCSL